MPLPQRVSRDERVNYFATTDSRSRKIKFGIKGKDRTKHVYVIGKTGMGKSTLLENMAIQDIQNGEGLAFVDPHGKTADLLLSYVPKERMKDVLYFAPFDMEYPVAFNVMEDVGPDRRHLVVAGLMSAFKKIWVDAWSARMEYILQNCLQALLEYPGATLLGINKMLSDKKYREMVVENVKDPSTKSFWVDEFAKYTDRFAAEATPAIQNKVGQFTSNPVIRNIIGQPVSSFDLRQMMDERKILIVNLSKGLVGEGNANLLGSMLITKIYLAAMSRADVPESVMRTLPNFYLYVDEFQSFANESFADILSEARKYKLNLTMAHQYIEQMSEEVRAAVFGNVGTMVTFRVGAYDAEVLEKEFAPQFTAEDLVNLGVYQIYLKLMIDGVSSQPFSATTLSPIDPPERIVKDEVIASSQKQFGRSRAGVEAVIEEQLRGQSAPGGPPKRPAATSVRPRRESEASKQLETLIVPKDLRDARETPRVEIERPPAPPQEVPREIQREVRREVQRPKPLQEEHKPFSNLKSAVATATNNTVPPTLTSVVAAATGTRPLQQKNHTQQQGHRVQHPPKPQRTPEAERKPQVKPGTPPINSAGRNQLKEALGALLKQQGAPHEEKQQEKQNEKQKSPPRSETPPSAPPQGGMSDEELRKILEVPES